VLRMPKSEGHAAESHIAGPAGLVCAPGCAGAWLEYMAAEAVGLEMQTHGAVVPASAGETALHNCNVPQLYTLT
jgi:hypothetical protein